MSLPVILPILLERGFFWFSIAEVTERYTNAIVNTDLDQTIDGAEFRSPMFQRPFQYLQRFNQRQELRGIRADEPHGTPQECIEVLLRYVLSFTYLTVLHFNPHAEEDSYLDSKFDGSCSRIVVHLTSLSRHLFCFVISLGTVASKILRGPNCDILSTSSTFSFSHANSQCSVVKFSHQIYRDS